MKNVILLFTLLNLTACGSYSIATIDVPPQSTIVEVEQAKNDLFVNTNTWMIDNFTNAKSVIQYSDKEAGVVAGRYLLRTSIISNGYTTQENDVFAVINIRVKDNSSSITITPEQFQTYTGSMVAEEYKVKEEDVVSQIQGLIDSYRSYIIAKQEDKY